jgi:hypothetical protein
MCGGEIARIAMVDARNNHVHEIIPQEAISGLPSFIFAARHDSIFISLVGWFCLGGFAGICGFGGDAWAWVR